MIYVITGHLGSGKSLLAVRLAHDYLKAGRKVASNITLNLDKLLEPTSKAAATKLPYVPNEGHLEALGHGYDGKYDESKFGLVLLDEAGKWLNSRDWADKERRGLFAWLTHARKKGWDVALIVQDYEALDAQIRRSITEVYIYCVRLDRIKVPYLPIRLPRIHRGKGLYGGPQGEKYKTWTAQGDDYFAAYDTRESVRSEELYDDAGKPVDARGLSSMLPAWHLRGRYLPPRPSLAEYGVWLAKWLLLVMLLPLFLIGLPRSGRPIKGMGTAWRADLLELFPKTRPTPYDAARSGEG